MPILLNADHIAGSNGKFEPQRAYNFTLRVLPPGATIDTERLLAMSVVSYPFPERQTERIAIDFVNEVRWVAGKTQFSEESLVVRDWVDQDIAKVIEAWANKVYDPSTGAQGWAKHYKVDADLILFAPDGTEERTWLLKGIWPRQPRFGEGDMTQSRDNRITVVFCIDRVLKGQTRTSAA